MLQGQLIREVTAMTRRQGSAVTAMCHDPDCNILVTGDQSKLPCMMWNMLLTREIRVSLPTCCEICY